MAIENLEVLLLLLLQLKSDIFLAFLDYLSYFKGTNNNLSLFTDAFELALLRF